MAKKYESQGNVENLTDLEIYEAIRYLETISTNGVEKNGDSGLVISVSLLILLLGCLGVMLLYWR
jgi:hypothetical protein